MTATTIGVILGAGIALFTEGMFTSNYPRSVAGLGLIVVSLVAHWKAREKARDIR